MSKVRLRSLKEDMTWGRVGSGLLETDMVRSGLKIWYVKEGLENKDGYEMDRDERDDLMRYGWMYSGWLPVLRVKFWKNELVGRGDERRLGEKKVVGEGTTVEVVSGKVNGRWFMVV
ncbi:hypothetical protein HanXRQr2_Chr07g0309451 [Helianthus annuus]|uniref:Uncharacterized protein n=1 Tax=Helianthus annuus TaxID=4232 RepID=A0A9K3IMY0_HELAN|nr:hypothetical protein HanXRQr2_Chr07g0309451 [Helianthus annuus]